MNATLVGTIIQAFDLKPYQLQAPRWAFDRHYDIDAVFPVDTPAAQVRSMLQTLLAERFGLEYQHRKRNASGYALVNEKNGTVSLRRVPDGIASATQLGVGHIVIKRAPMSLLADILSQYVGRPVINQTAIEGCFDVTLKSAADTLRSSTAQGDDGGNDDTATGSENEASSIFTAVKEQTGLTLKPIKTEVDTMVVIRLSRTPTSN